MRTWRGLLAVALGVSVAAAAGGQAAEFRTVQQGRGILMTGVIEMGDEATFHALAARLQTAVVITTGPGGRVYPALAIGNEIHARGWSTLVPEETTCASACSLIWLAGQTRLLAAGARIGFHAEAVERNGQREEYHAEDFELRRYLTDLGYALDTAATIVNTRARAIRWYDVLELRANGIATDPYP